MSTPEDESPIFQEGIRRHLAAMGKTHCPREVPCFKRPDVHERTSVECECGRRFRRWKAFWLLVRGDMEGCPRELPAISPTHTYTGPIFTYVCPGCGRREECWERNWRGEPIPRFDGNAWRCTALLPEHVARVQGRTVIEYTTCGPECADKARARVESIGY